MKKINDNCNENTNLDFITDIEESESKLAFETAIGDMVNEPSFEWSEDFLYDTMY